MIVSRDDLELLLGYVSERKSRAAENLIINLLDKELEVRK